MSQTQECPHCSIKVLAGPAGLCPSCGKDVNDINKIRDSLRRNEICEHIYWGLVQHASIEQLTDELLDKGFTKFEIEKYNGDRLKKVSLRRKIVIRSYIWPGLALFLSPFFLFSVLIGLDSPLIYLSTGVSCAGIILFFKGLKELRILV